MMDISSAPFRKRARDEFGDGFDGDAVDEQKKSWDKLRMGIVGLINRVSSTNLPEIVAQLFALNLIRGRGILCRALLTAQGHSQMFTDVFASLVAVVNSKAPMVGEILIHRLVSRFLSGEPTEKTAAALFLGHLFNQAVVGELVILQMLHLLLASGDSERIDQAVQLVLVVGARLSIVNPGLLRGLFDIFHALLRDDLSSKSPHPRALLYRVEGLLDEWRQGFAQRPSIAAGLDLVSLDEQVPHDVALDDDELKPKPELDLFAPSTRFQVNEERYREFYAELKPDLDALVAKRGSTAVADVAPTPWVDPLAKVSSSRVVIQDQTGTDMENLRRGLYLTIMSSLSFEESATKILRMRIPPEMREEIPRMILECALHERTYLRYFGALGQRFCDLDRVYEAAFAKLFLDRYEAVHQLDSKQLRNVASLFAHLLATDSLGWKVLECIRLTEDDTTSSSRIFVKILFQEVSQQIGIATFCDRLMHPSFDTQGLFPTDSSRNARFSVNYFTAIGLGQVTADLRALIPELIEREEAEHDPQDEDGFEDDSEFSDEDEDDDGEMESSEGESGAKAVKLESSEFRPSYFEDRHLGLQVPRDYDLRDNARPVDDEPRDRLKVELELSTRSSSLPLGDPQEDIAQSKDSKLHDVEHKRYRSRWDAVDPVRASSGGSDTQPPSAEESQRRYVSRWDREETKSST